MDNMKKTALTILILISATIASFSQPKKVAIILISDAENSTEANYDKSVNMYIVEHLKKVSNIIIADYSGQVSNKVKDDIGADSGKFADIAVTNDAIGKNIDKLILVYYSADPTEQQMISGGVKKIYYSCRIHFYVQIINTANNQILNSKQFYGSVGTAINTKEIYKTKEASVKAAMDGSSLTDYTGKITINIDNYLNKTIAL